MNEQSSTISAVVPRTKRQVHKVSVVTVTYNARDSLRLTMESVMRQSFPDMDHVVVDGGSTDGTQAIAQEYELGSFVSETDNGVYDAMDKGARLAKGDIVIFLNAGDTFFDDHVCYDVAEFFQETDADIVFGNIMPVYLQHGDRHDHGAFRAGELLNLSYLRNRHQIRDESIHHQATFYRTSVFANTAFECVEPAGTGEYHVLISALFKHKANARYIPRNISRFVLGGISTRAFDAEWKRFVACREALRRLYGVKRKWIVLRDKYEFHGGIPPDPVLSGTPSSYHRGGSILSTIKRWTRKTPFFHIYDRLATGLTERVVSRLLPHFDDLKAAIVKSSRLNRKEVEALAEQMEQQTRSVIEQIAAEHRVVVAALLANHGRVPDKLLEDDEFAARGYKVFSESDEDGLIQYLIEACEIPNKTFVEISGADHTKPRSNTRFLAFNNNWSGLLIEGNADAVSRIKNSDWYRGSTVNAVNSPVTAENINDTLSANGLVGDIGLLSIDVDGVDYWIWKAIQTVVPRIVICEFNGLYGDEAAVTVPYASAFERMSQHYLGIYAGASLQALVRLGEVKGYTFIGTNIGGNNAFFVRNDVFAKAELKPSKRGFLAPQFHDVRNADGSLSYLSIERARSLIAGLPIVDLETGKTTSVGDILAPKTKSKCNG